MEDVLNTKESFPIIKKNIKNNTLCKKKNSQIDCLKVTKLQGIQNL